MSARFMKIPQTPDQHEHDAKGDGEERHADRRLLGATAAAFANVFRQDSDVGQRVPEGGQVHLCLC